MNPPTMLRQLGGAGLLLLIGGRALAHDPIFGLGPHTLFAQGTEVALEAGAERAGAERSRELGLTLAYGVTAQWTAGASVPYVQRRDAAARTAGTGSLSLFTKYRFWRNDLPGAQEALALALRIELDTADPASEPPLGPGATDTVAGISYGFEGRKWYRWASLRYRSNGARGGLERGDVLLLDLVGGIRPRQTQYTEPDLVWLLELNGVLSARARRDATTLAQTGGAEWFLAPGLFWTRRNLALKAGVQLPVASQRRDGAETDYRASLSVELHL